MAEKRFTDDGIGEIENQSFTDNLTGKTYWIDNGLDEIVDLLNTLNDENEQLETKWKRCRDWINSDKNDYELTLAFIKNKGYSLKDVLEYEKELKMND